jgi:ribosomal protein L11
MKIVKVKNTDTNIEVPAEIRVYTSKKVSVLIKDFETSKLIMKDMTSRDGVNWATSDGLFTCNIPEDMFAKDAGEVLVKISKK